MNPNDPLPCLLGNRIPVGFIVSITYMTRLPGFYREAHIMTIWSHTFTQHRFKRFNSYLADSEDDSVEFEHIPSSVCIPILSTRTEALENFLKHKLRFIRNLGEHYDYEVIG